MVDPTYLCKLLWLEPLEKFELGGACVGGWCIFSELAISPKLKNIYIKIGQTLKAHLAYQHPFLDYVISLPYRF